MSVPMTVEETILSPTPAEEIWELCGAPASIADRSPAVGKSSMDGDVRYVELTGAGQARERITQHDDAEHYYTYDYLDGPLVLDSMSSRFAVQSTVDGGSEIVWPAIFTAVDGAQGAALAQAVGGMYQAGLNSLTALVAASHS
ncbi:hypothetical protein AXA44_08295 [Rhodococcus sp. SC4]|nr:hypothetical protein AXA44_08295 [Rhodococcus sp. SC4]